MTTRTTNWLLAIIIAALLSCAGPLLDGLGPDDNSAKLVQSGATLDAINSEAARARFTRAAGLICGNADFVELDASTIQCVPRRASVGKGAVVQVAGVTP